MDNAKYQTIQINLGLCWNQNGKSGEFDQELGRFLVENKFPHCGIVSESYVDSWQAEDSGEVYQDQCIAFAITIPRVHRMALAEIEQRIESIRVILKQDAIGFTTTTPNGNVYSDVFYGLGNKPDGAYAFDSAKFHYVK
jgi:hypothetical protein